MLHINRLNRTEWEIYDQTASSESNNPKILIEPIIPGSHLDNTKCIYF